MMGTNSMSFLNTFVNGLGMGLGIGLGFEIARILFPRLLGVFG